MTLERKKDAGEDGGEDMGEEGEPDSTSEYTDHWLATRNSADRVERRKLGRAETMVMGKRKGILEGSVERRRKPENMTS